jgi:hypothetical protein
MMLMRFSSKIQEAPTRMHQHIQRGIKAVGHVPFLLILAATCLAQPRDSLRCYVWDFAMRNGMRTELTRQLTVEFEEKLTQKKFCKVLERRNYARLVAQKDNEKAILRLDGISRATVDTLKAYDANTVVFGEVYDDISSGSYKVTLTFQHFDNSKSVWSVSIRRGLINDAASREQAMDDLVRLILDDTMSADREANRKMYYVQISRVLNGFILRAKNLKDAFRYLPDLAYGNRQIARDLTAAVTEYNTVVDSLKINRDALTESVSTNWRKPDLSDSFKQLLQYALLDIHETEILVFNDMLAKILAIVNGKISDTNEAEMTKANIRASVPGRIEILNAKLIQFEHKSTAFLDQLKP